MSFLKPNVTVNAPEIPDPPPAEPVKPIKPKAVSELEKRLKDKRRVSTEDTILTSPKGVLEEAPLSYASLMSTADTKTMQNFLTNGKYKA
tara:strand:+ start:148 stop:417 length:270 start_codon:yes stop_codon:yes gene_type:complete